ncbi:helix-turn-helix domain-containing protein [Pseudoxanthomonas winnipegensis]|uniref:helix-turn-helix domain-containing protein n=1 Tax=Pseudoxanthomonas winnipegensis TaxID=2480810 RepID=UPI00102D92FA|nr:helix-turn-helix domain-containing protein [Pseudoxanthomonas winnipegensis]TAA12233.1 helix-turn-helix domain-containing protein [Pseudoxanthomonas winnipegensis]TAH70235.1 helix-turn-helix domain-containing protein [Pseudoxanthomonas winnipegensis]
MSPHRIAVVAFDRISPFHLAVPCQVFESRPEPGLPAFELRVCAAEPGPLRTDAGFSVQPAHGLEGLDGADTVIVPSWRDRDEPAPAALIDALRRAHAAGAQLVGLCLGTFVLADAGLLDGRPATTHWAALETFARRHPQVRLQPDVLYVDDGDVLTSAGTVAGIDCCLHLVRRLHGAEVANRIARRPVVAPHRQGGQTQYIEQPLPTDPGDERLAQVLEWAMTHLDQRLDVDALAARALMSRRTFTRRFRQATGASLGDWLAHQRLARAQRLLETSDLALDRVAAEAGFGSAFSLRQRFAATLGTSPSAYRRSFRG